MAIELRNYDLFITEFTDKEGNVKDIVRIDSRLAFNDEFIQACEENGVKRVDFSKEGKANHDDNGNQEPE